MLATTTTQRKPLEYLKVPAFAREVGLSERTVRRAISRGELAHVRVGQTILIPRSVLKIRLTEGEGENSETR